MARSGGSRAVVVAGGIQGQDRVRIGAARAHLGGHPDRLHQLVFAGALEQRSLGVALMQYGHWVT